MERDSRTIKLVPEACPGCGAQLDAASNLTTNQRPVEGDFTVCLYCTTRLRFGHELRLELVQQEVLDELPEDERVFLAQVVAICQQINLPT